MKKFITGLTLFAFLALVGTAEAATLYSAASTQLTQASPDFSSGMFDASGHENLTFSFDYEAESLDNTDSFTYGWSSGGIDNDLATVNGINEGSAGDETSTVSISLPLGAQMADLEVYIRVTANSGSDAVNLTNISVDGDVVVSGTITNNESESYTTIQAAVDGTDAGGTVTVPAGIYSENVVLNKAITLLGANAGVPGNGSRGSESIIDGGGITSPIQITSDNVVIDGFTLQGGYNGLGVGVYALGEKDNVEIMHNIITDNAIGVYPSGDNFVIRHNLFDSNNQPGAAGGAGIYTDIATNNLQIEGNEFRNHTTNNPVIFAAVASPTHLNLTFSNNNVHDNFSGVYVLAVDGATFSGNTIMATDATGLSFSGGNSNVAISNNTITNSARGIRIEDAGYGFGPNSAFSLSGNTFENNSEYDVRILPGGYSGNEFNVPPTITLNGEGTVFVFSSNGYEDEGATAVDSLGNSVNVTDDSESFNFKELGTYTITYSATDFGGNTATTTRTVVVRASTPGGGGGGSRGNSAGAASSQASAAVANAGVTLPAPAASVVTPGEVLGATTLVPAEFIGQVLGAADVSVTLLSAQAISSLPPAERQAYVTNTKIVLVAKISQLIAMLQAEITNASN